eukprot:9000666-Ditylum_brightwellii.AAC.1
MRNLTVALQSASLAASSTTTGTTTTEGEETTEDGPQKKKMKTNHATNVKRDLYNILDPSFARGKDVILIP